MILYPRCYLEKITDLKIEYLKQNKIYGLILDVDNTLINYDLEMLEGLKNWHEEITNAGIKTIIVSNTNKIGKIEKVANELEIEYVPFACKPLKKGLLKGKEKLGLESKNIAVIGDQIFTDVLGANRCQMFSILVKPLDIKDIWITKIKRPIEELVVKKYLKSKEEK